MDFYWKVPIEWTVVSKFRTLISQWKLLWLVILQCKRQWRVVSGSLLKEHLGLIISFQLCGNFRSFRWVKSNLKWVNSFALFISWTSETEFFLSLTKFRILHFNVFIENIFLSSSLRFPMSNDSKVLVLTRKVFIVFWGEDRDKYVLKLPQGLK